MTRTATKQQKTYRLDPEVVRLLGEMSLDLKTSKTNVLEEAVRAFHNMHREESPAGMLRLMGQKLIKLSEDFDDEWAGQTEAEEG